MKDAMRKILGWDGYLSTISILRSRCLICFDALWECIEATQLFQKPALQMVCSRWMASTSSFWRMAWRCVTRAYNGLQRWDLLRKCSFHWSNQWEVQFARNWSGFTMLIWDLASRWLRANTCTAYRFYFVGDTEVSHHLRMAWRHTVSSDNSYPTSSKIIKVLLTTSKNIFLKPNPSCPAMITLCAWQSA